MEKKERRPSPPDGSWKGKKGSQHCLADDGKVSKVVSTASQIMEK
jgi:hypothetical protein